MKILATVLGSFAVRMKKLSHFLFETDFGPFRAWISTYLLFLVVYIISPKLGVVGYVLSAIALALNVAALLAAVVAFLLALVRCRWLRAMGQLLLGVIGVVLFVVGALVGSWAIHEVPFFAEGHYSEKSVEVKCGTPPSVAFKMTFLGRHPIMSEYNASVVFPSDKCVRLLQLGSANPYAVYRLPTGEFYIHDVDCKYGIERYRINTERETVEMMEDETWVEISDGYGQTTPVGDSLKGRVYLGLVNPRKGKFIAGEGDPYADVAEPASAATER